MIEAKLVDAVICIAINNDKDQGKDQDYPAS